MKIGLILTDKDFSKLQYPVVVEMYDKVATIGQHSMSLRKKYHAEFSVTERKKIRDYYNLFYKWYLVTGTPLEYNTTPREYKFMERVINFFGTL